MAIRRTGGHGEVRQTATCRLPLPRHHLCLLTGRPAGLRCRYASGVVEPVGACGLDLGLQAAAAGGELAHEGEA